MKQIHHKTSIFFIQNFLNNIANIQNTPIVSVDRNTRFNDEPFLYQYSSRFYSSKNGRIDRKNLDWGGGISFNQKQAILKAVAEGIERFSLGIYEKKDFIYKSIEEISSNFLNPKNVVSFSTRQMVQNPNLNIGKKDKFYWVQGINLLDKKEIWLPAQLVFVPYSYNKEKIIRFPISTGAAAGTSIESAIYRGICEIIERDSFIIFYLNKLSPPLIKLSQNNLLIQKLIKYFQRYGLELKIFDITTDLKIPSILSILIDQSGIGPYITLGLKSSINYEEAIIGSIEEAQHTRSWLRHEILKVKEEDLYKIKKNFINIYSQKDRGLFWFDADYVNMLDFFLKSTKFKVIKKKLWVAL